MIRHPHSYSLLKTFTLRPTQQRRVPHRLRHFHVLRAYSPEPQLHDNPEPPFKRRHQHPYQALHHSQHHQQATQAPSFHHREHRAQQQADPAKTGDKVKTAAPRTVQCRRDAAALRRWLPPHVLPITPMSVPGNPPATMRDRWLLTARSASESARGAGRGGMVVCWYRRWGEFGVPRGTKGGGRSGDGTVWHIRWMRKVKRHSSSPRDYANT